MGLDDPLDRRLGIRTLAASHLRVVVPDVGMSSCLLLAGEAWTRSGPQELLTWMAAGPGPLKCRAAWRYYISTDIYWIHASYLVLLGRRLRGYTGHRYSKHLA